VRERVAPGHTVSTLDDVQNFRCELIDPVSGEHGAARRDVNRPRRSAV
jgi:hypothetical protein